MSIDALTQITDIREAPDQCSPGDQQRLRIHVPNIKTTLALGAKAPGGKPREVDTGAPNYDGFGVHTLGHIHMSASKDVASSTATLQAKGDIHIQSEGGLLWAGSHEQALLASQANAMIMGGGGVVIAGGAAVTWAPNEEPDGSEPKPPGWMSGFGAAGGGINQVWAGIDAAVAVALGVKGIIDAKTARPKGLDLAITIANLLLGNLGGAIVSGLGAANSDPIGGIVIHGTGGFIAGSTHTMGLYSLTGTTVGSALGVTVVAPAVSVTGILGTTVEAGRSVEVKSGGTAALTAHAQTLVSSRTADVTLLAEAIFIGGTMGEEGATQKKTNKVELISLSYIANTDEYRVNADKNYTVDGKAAVSLGAKSTFTIQSGVDLTLKASNIELRGDKKASLHIPGGMGLTMKKSELFIGKNTATPPFDKAAAGKGKRGKQKSRAVDAAKAAWEEKCKEMTAGDVGIKFKKSKISLIVKGNQFHIDDGKFTTGSLVWKK